MGFRTYSLELPEPIILMIRLFSRLLSLLRLIESDDVRKTAIFVT